MSQICNCVVCGHCFDQNDLKVKTRTIYNINIKEKVCPGCGSTQWESLVQGEYLDKFLNFADTDLN